jgi:nitroreductase
MNQLLEFLDRHSTPARIMVEPGPDREQLKQILAVAMSAPDHGRIQPYRFISIRGEARNELSRVFGEACQRRDPNVPSYYLKKQQDKPLRAPLIVVVVASLVESAKIPEIEQMLCAGAVAHNILLGAKAMGFGSIWLTGDNAYDQAVLQALDLADNEKIIGFIYLGSVTAKTNPREQADAESKLSDWPAK